VATSMKCPLSTSLTWTPSQRALNEKLLMGLPSKRWIAKRNGISTKLIRAFVRPVAHKRNKFQEKSLNLPTPLEVFNELHDERYFCIA